MSAELARLGRRGLGGATRSQRERRLKSYAPCVRCGIHLQAQLTLSGSERRRHWIWLLGSDIRGKKNQMQQSKQTEMVTSADGTADRRLRWNSGRPVNGRQVVHKIVTSRPYGGVVTQINE